MADLLVCIDGWMFMIEVKMPGERPTQLQLADGEEVVQSGGVWFVGYSLEQTLESIRRVLAVKALR